MYSYNLRGCKPQPLIAAETRPQCVASCSPSKPEVKRESISLPIENHTHRRKPLLSLFGQATPELADD